MQRELLTGMVLSADFIYTRGSNLASLVNLNQPLPNAAGNNALGAAAVPELRVHRVARAEREVDLQGPRSRRGEALLQGLRVRRVVHASAIRRTTRRNS